MRIVIHLFAVDGEHAAGLAHAQHLHTRQLPVQIARQRGQMGDVLHMLFLVEHGLIQVRNGPALGNIERELRGELLGSLRGHGVAPGAELRQLLIILVESKIAMHHGGYADGGQLRQLHAILFSHVLFEIGKCVLHARPHISQMISPHAVFQTVLPRMITGSNWRMIGADQNGLNAGGTQLHAQYGLAFQKILLHIHIFGSFHF